MSKELAGTLVERAVRQPQPESCFATSENGAAEPPVLAAASGEPLPAAPLGVAPDPDPLVPAPPALMTVPAAPAVAPDPGAPLAPAPPAPESESIGTHTPAEQKLSFAQSALPAQLVLQAFALHA